MFNAALATYDLRLTVQVETISISLGTYTSLLLQVAEASNRDPKEYIPLLNELRKVEPETYRAYRIDMLREDWTGALTHLAKVFCCNYVCFLWCCGVHCL